MRLNRSQSGLILCLLAVFSVTNSQHHSRAIQACILPTPSNSRSSKTYLAKDGGGRSAPIQSWSRVRASESTKQNNLADTHRNSNVTDKLRLIRTMALYSSHHFNEQCSRPFSQNKHYRQQLVQLSRSLYKRQ